MVLSVQAGERWWGSREATYDMDLHIENARCQCDHPEHTVPSAWCHGEVLLKLAVSLENQFHIPEVSS